MDNYTKKIIYYMNNQRFNKDLKDYNYDFEVRDDICGDFVRIKIKLDDFKIKELGYLFHGCSLNIASLEILFNWIQKKDISRLNEMGLRDYILEELNPPQRKTHCVDLSIKVINKFLKLIDLE